MAIVTTAAPLSSGELSARWTAFFEESDLRRKILQIAEAYPQERALLVSFTDLERTDRQLADHLLARPEAALAAGQVAIKEALPASLQFSGEIHLRLHELPSSNKVPIHLLRREHLGQAMAVEGIVRRATTPLPQVVEAVFECGACRQRIRWPQETTIPILRTPTECDPNQGGCGKPAFRARFSFLEAESRTVDFQRLEVQEEPEGLKGGSHPENLTVLLTEDLVEQIAPGTRVTVNGVLRPVPRAVPSRGSGATSNVLDVVMVAFSVERRSKEYMEIEISDHDRAEIEKWRQSPEVLDRIVRSIAPSIKGMTMEKKAIALQLFGGVEKILPDGVRIRGDSHTLLIGDPGTGKSQLLLYVARTAPRGIYTSGKGTTSAGLTAAAVKDEFSGGRWTLEAGAMVLADGGFLVIDEIDKMSEADRSALHEGLEQGQISISKAGITATLRARCPVLAAANPEFGRFTEESNPVKQFNLPVTLLSRFDVILPIRDRPEEEADRKLARALLKQHAEAEEREASRLQSVEPVVPADEAIFTQEFLKKYIAYARQNVRPVMEADAYGKIEEYYLNMRRRVPAQDEDREKGGVAITPRQLEALVRLTEAAARARLSPRATSEDANRAIEVIEYFLQQLTTTEGGSRDIDLVYSGITAGQRNIIARVRELAQELTATSPAGFTEERLIELARAQNLPEPSVRRAFQDLLRANELISPRHDLYKAV